MTYVSKKIEELLPANYNPRKDLKPGDKEYEKLKNSIEHFGYVDPIIWNKRTNTVVGGHQRVKVLKDLGYTNIEVVEVDLDLENEKALNIALNKISGDWEPEKLEDLLRELNNETDLDIELTGFDLDELETLFSGSIDELEDTDENEEEIDEADEIDLEEELKQAIANTKSRQGDLYKLGNHYLLCGDATKIEDIQRLTNGKKVNLYLTDPPYGVNIVNGNKIKRYTHDNTITQDENGKMVYAGKIGMDKPFGRIAHDEKTKFNTSENKIIKANVYIPIKGDDTVETARLNYELIKDIADEQVIFGGNYFTEFLPPRACWIVWDKKTKAPNFAPFELAWTSRNTHALYYEYLWAGLCKEGSKQDEGKKRVHPTQKPVGMLAKILEDFSNKDDVVIDCFGGSGSTLIACEKTGRKCLMIEYEPYYVDVIVKRWEEYTGQKAELIESGVDQNGRDAETE